MKIHVLGRSNAIQELKETYPQADWIFSSNLEAAIMDTESDILFHLDNDAIKIDFSNTTKTVVVNAVCEKLSEYAHGKNVVRINGWNGFLKRQTWEMSGVSNSALDALANTIGVNIKWLPDEPGFVAPRVIAMIVNEAFFALEQSVSSISDIDVALKLGTNYPQGPFEWGNQIGLKEITQLLEVLSKQSPIYKPSALLTQKASEI
jgi:3-hydroxybutyryl-CoA dehydrogenase